MSNKILIVTSGGSQLLTQFSVLNTLINLDNYEINLLYNGVESEGVDRFFRIISRVLNLNYLGQILFDIKPFKVSKSDFIRNLFIRENITLNNRCSSNFPILKQYRHPDILSIPVRVKMISDMSLISYIKPKKKVFTVDGVVDILPERDFTGLRYWYLRGCLNILPNRDIIYSPNYLKEDTKRLGIYRMVDIKPLIRELSQISLVQNFKKKYFRIKRDFLIFSQHYSLSEDVRIQNEIEYYQRIINYCGQKKGSQILFKPHPRDTMYKIKMIGNLNIDNLTIVSRRDQGIPIEFFVDEINEMNTQLITGNSSAPFCFNRPEDIISVYSEELLSHSLNHKINSFAIKNNIKLIEV